MPKFRPVQSYLITYNFNPEHTGLKSQILGLGKINLLVETSKSYNILNKTAFIKKVISRSAFSFS